MAIDLRNKSGAAAVLDEPPPPRPRPRPPPEAVRPYYPDRVIGDPAAWESDFAHALGRVAVRLDNRTVDELRHQALHHPDPVLREQALYEYADRNEDDAVDLLREAVARDTDVQVRWDALWAIQKLGTREAVRALRDFRPTQPTARGPHHAERG